MTETFADVMFREASRRFHTRFWLISDLQQSDYDRAQRYMHTAVDDLQRIGTKLDGICYLGDATEGKNIAVLNRMIDMQLEAIDSIGVPVYYAIGNHEMELYRLQRSENATVRGVIPFYEAVRHRKGWHCVASQEDFWFAEELPEFTMLFFSDHLAEDGSWLAFHERMPEPTMPYPYTKADWEAVRDRFAASPKPVFTFAHCAFPGGNRPAALLAQMMPLPRSFRAHFHGHAHIGDAKWAGQNLYRQIAAVDDHPILQFDVASLDHWRGTTVRSAFFDYYGNAEYGVFFRDHVNGRWEQCFFSAHDAASAGVPEHIAAGL